MGDVVYQIYPRSFDRNLAGVTARLGYLAALGQTVDNMPVIIHIIKAEGRIAVYLKTQRRSQIFFSRGRHLQKLHERHVARQCNEDIIFAARIGLHKPLNIMHDGLIPLLVLQIKKRQDTVSLELVVGQPLLQGNQNHLFLLEYDADTLHNVLLFR